MSVEERSRPPPRTTGSPPRAPERRTPGELRRVAAVVRSHTLGMMLSAARMVCRAARLETIADVRELAAASVPET